MIKATSKIWLDEREIEFSFVRSSGPGGQNVNKVATAVQLRFDVARSPSLPEEVRGRLMEIAANRIHADSVLLIEARRFRSQARNREDALQRLVALIREAARRPKPRRKTRPSVAAERRRLDEKRRRGEIKRRRRSIGSPRNDDSPLV
jgi:ribosome-associated protein